MSDDLIARLRERRCVDCGQPSPSITCRDCSLSRVLTALEAGHKGGTS